MMKKRLKTAILAGLLAGLTMMQPVYGANFTLAAVKQVIRMDENGFAHSSTQQQEPNAENIPDGQTPDMNALPPADQNVNTDALPSSDQNVNTDALPPADQNVNTDALPPEDQNTNTNVSLPADQSTGTNTLPPEEQTADSNTLPSADQTADTNALPPEDQTADTDTQPSTEQPPEQHASNLPAGIRALDPTKPMIALTYDDGPYAPVGNRIMDVMNQYNSKCTFFMVGNRVPSYAAEVQRMTREGFEVANHTQDHNNLKKLNAAQIHVQVNSCNDIIQSVSGVRPTLMRLPGGNKNDTVVANTGMPMIMWNIDTNDWKTKNTQSTVNAVLGKVKDGDIVLMHELYPATAAATETLVPALVSQGFQLVTVSELAYYKGYSLNAGQLYYNMR